MKPQETHREATRIRHLSRAPSARSGDMASQKRSVRWPGFVHHFAYSFLIRKLRWVPLAARSEEHTSELQSRLHLVCRLLLEKKKKKINGRLSSTAINVKRMHFKRQR